MKHITQRSVSDWGMRWRVFVYLGLIITALIAGGAYVYGKKNLGPKFGWILAAYGANSLGVSNLKVPVINLPAGQIVAAFEPSYQARKNFRYAVKTFYWAPAAGYSLSLAILVIVGRTLRRKKEDDEHLRGAEMTDAKTLKKMLRRNPSNFNLGGVPIPIEIEPNHFLFAGGTGSGKTLAFRQALETIQRQDQRAIIADPGGEFLTTFYRDGDVVLNPFDERCAGWSPFAEMRGVWDADRLAKSFIPDGHGDQGEWNFFAQQLFSAVLVRLWNRGNATNGELARILAIAESSEIRELVAGLPAQRMFDPGNERYLGSVLSIIGSYAKLLTWLDPTVGQDGFSIRNWIENETRGWIYMTYRDDQLATLRPLIAAWLDVAASAILAMNENRERRIWLALDEFAGLGKIQSIEPFLTKARKAGGCALLGLQAISQLHDTYGPKKAQTLLACLGTWLVLRQGDPETAEAMSLFVGDREVLRQNESGSKGGDGSGNWSEQVTKTRLIMPSELQRLAPRHGFLSLLGPYPVCPVEMPIPDKRLEAAPAFLLHDHRLLPAETAVKKPADGLDFKDW